MDSDKKPVEFVPWAHYNFLERKARLNDINERLIHKLTEKNEEMIGDNEWWRKEYGSLYAEKMNMEKERNELRDELAAIKRKWWYKLFGG